MKLFEVLQTSNQRAKTANSHNPIKSFFQPTKSVFSGILKSGSTSEIAGLVKTLYEKHVSLEKQNKKMHSADKRLLSEAEKMFQEEVAYVLHIERDSVAPFISETLKKIKEASML